jgi:FkbM family methyltransferase
MSELTLLRTITTSLPRVRGMGQIATRVASFYARKPREEVDVEALGFRWRLRPRECLDKQLLFCAGHYDRAELKALNDLVRPDDVFLDAGANIGAYSLVLSRKAKRVVAVEADPDTHRRLKHHVEVNGASNIIPCNVGLAEDFTTLKLGIVTGGNTSGNSFLVNNDGQTVDVPCKPLLNVLREAGVERLDVAKFDIEGMEYRVLRRFMAEAPERFKPRAMLVEWSHYYFDKAGGNPLDLLKANGYAIRHLRDENYIAER